MYTIEKTKLERVCLIKPDINYDFRGEFVETYNKRFFESFFPDIKFLIDDVSFSRKNVLRGLHGNKDDKTWKLIQCLQGSILQTVVDLDINSDTFLQWQQFSLNDKNRWQILIPPQCVNGHLCLSDTCIFSYKISTYYEDQKQTEYYYKSLKIPWPIENPILSQRDSSSLLIESVLNITENL